MAAGEKKLSQLPQQNIFPSNALIYGTSGSSSYAFTLQAMQNLIKYSSSVANLFTTPLNITRSGQNITVPANRTWNIFGEEFTNPSSVTLTVPYAATGKTRIDLLVANQSNTFVLVTGTEVDLPAAPSAPPVPFMTLEATFLIVNDNSVTDPGEPSAPVYLGIYLSESSLMGSVPRPYLGYFAFIVNETENLLYQYNGVEWIIVDLNNSGGSQTLSETLANDNQTDGFNILVTNGDAIELQNTSLLKDGSYNFGGYGGISRICSNNYEDMWQNGIRHVFDNNGFIRNSTNCFDIVPDASFDNTLRFKVDSLWTLDNGTTYICTDATEGAAVWEIYITNVLTLDQVLNEGNESLYDAKIGKLYLYDFSKNFYGAIQIANGIFSVGDTTTGNTLFSMQLGVFKIFNTLFNSAFLNFQSLTANRTFTFQNKSGTVAMLDDVPTKTSDLINDGDNGTSHFITLEDLPSNLILYPTTVSSGIGGYNKLVSSITDPSYNTTAVDVSTGAITGTDQLIAGLITSSNIIVGNPGIFNITTIGNIRKVSGAGQAEFYFRVYKRDAGGTETLILQSSNTPQITSAIYTEFSATGLWNDGVFISTDMIVMKFYGTKVGSGSSPTYDFQFGGTQPVRTLVPIPLTVVPNLSLDELSDVEITSPTNNQIPAYESASSLWKNKTIIEDSIVSGVTDKAPSQNAVFDALALKQDELFDFNTRKGFNFFEDFLGYSGNSNFNSYGISTATSGTGAQVTATTSYPNRTNQQGVVQLGSGTILTGLASITLGSSNGTSHYLGNGVYTIQTFINIETLSTSLERFYAIIGSTTVTNLANANGIFFIYDEGGIGAYGAASANFKCVTSNALTRTITTTSTPVVASQWYVLKIVVNANASSVEFFIDDALVATHTTNIPTVITPKIAIQKTVGITNRNMFCDYLAVKQIYTNPR